jgi:arylsulfatase A-like enzyme/predicted negative regulator of RcsB-dependent stress response
MLLGVGERYRGWLRIRGIGCGGLALVALAGLGCQEEAERPRNVLLVSIDTVRADRIGCYGREDAGTATLDALAARGTRFADATAPSPMTLPSHASLFSGHDPLRHRMRHNGLFALPPETVSLTERFAAAGFRTGAFVGSIVLAEQYGLAQGFETYTVPGRETAPGLLYVSERSAQAVNRDALTWLDSLGEDRFFLFAHYMEPHAPYDPPEPERSRFRDRYQGEVAAADRALGELLAALEERGLLDGTLVLVVSDHGESLGEHGELTHGLFLYQSTLHVPMLAAGPGVRPGHVVHAPVGLVDVAPTLLDAVDLAAGEPGDGESLWPAMSGMEGRRGRGIYAETFVPRYDYGWSELRALRRDGLKYVLAPRPELYSLPEDPRESRNLARSERASAAAMATEIERLVARLEARGPEPGRVELAPEEREALESLGYLRGAGGGGVPSTLADPKDRIGEAVVLDRPDQLLRRGEYAEAEELLRELIAANPAYLDTRLRLVVVLIHQGKTEAAAAAGRALDEAAERAPHGRRMAAQAHLLLAQMYLDHARIEEAARELEQALAAPQSSKVHDLLAAIYHDLGRRDDAIRVLRDLESSGYASERSRHMLRLLEAQGPPPG